MLKSTKTLVLALVVSAVMIAGCDDLLSTEPTEYVGPDVAFENIDGIEAILTSAYNRTQGWGRYGNQLMLAPDVLADNTQQHPIPSGRYDTESTNTHGAHITFWNNAYNTINDANYVIEGVEALEGVNQEARDRLRGEALFLRGHTYFDLARTYGYEPGREVDGWSQSVIIRNEATRDVTDADLRSRSSNEEVYNQAVSDLEEALNLLEGNDRGVYFANYEAAHALLARIHLYLESWEQAVDYATQAMNLTGVDLVDEETFADNIFEQAPNPESMLELSIDPVEESLGSNDALNAYTTPAAWFDVLPSDELLALYDEDDVRNSLFAVADDGHTYILKWTESEGPYTDNVPMVRYPELLLIRAEAHAELGNLEGALDDLGTLQEARGIEPFESSSYQAIIDEILEERRRELAFEGHRWYDLKRRAMDIPKQGDLSTISYDDYRLLPPLPNDEVDNNPDLDQNPGY